MQSKVLIVSQPFGLGDIIFTQTIAHEFIDDGYKVIWPVDRDAEMLNAAYPEILFIDKAMTNFDLECKEFKEENGIRYLPMRFSEWLMKRQYWEHMRSKYDFLGMDWRRWIDYAMPLRNRQREKELMSAIGLKKGEQYNLLQMKFGAEGKYVIQPLRAANGLKDLVLDFVPGYTLFDWCGIIENATHIHAVSSSSLYLFEVLNLKAEQIHLYARKPYEQDFKYVKFLMTKNYKLHL